MAFAGKKIVSVTAKENIMSVLKWFLPSVEGFSAVPYWDQSRYSWGYGTQAPGPSGTITRDEALAAMTDHVMGDYTRLYSVITRVLSVNQWAALLSFSYNLGIGNALNIVPYINSSDDAVLGDHWNRYVYAGGQVNQALIDRRAKEWELWNT